jgi:hypothetical protein
MMEEMQNQENKVSEINLMDIFKKNNPIISGHEEEPEQLQKAESQQKKKESKSEQPKEVEKPVLEDEDDDDDKSIEEKKQDQNKKQEKSNNYEEEYQKLEKKLKDSQKWGNENNKKLVAYAKSVEKLKEDGILTDDEASSLLDHTKIESVQEEKPFILECAEIWDKEINYMRKYSSNSEDIDNYTKAFQAFMQSATQSELDEVLEEFKELKDDGDEVKFTKRMLEIGKEWYEDIYKDIFEVGSLKHLKQKYAEKETKLQNRIDKLEKTIEKYKKKYEDYTESNLHLPSGNSASSPTENGGAFDLGKTFGKRFEPRQSF